jgi:hypothetical protein
MNTLALSMWIHQKYYVPFYRAQEMAEEMEYHKRKQEDRH